MCGLEEGVTILNRLKPVTPGFEVKKNFMLTSAEHEISNADKFKTTRK